MSHHRDPHHHKRLGRFHYNEKRLHTYIQSYAQEEEEAAKEEQIRIFVIARQRTDFAVKTYIALFVAAVTYNFATNHITELMSSSHYPPLAVTKSTQYGGGTQRDKSRTPRTFRKPGSSGVWPTQP